MERFKTDSVWRGHWKGLSNHVDGKVVPDWPARISLLLLSLGAAVLSLVFGWVLTAPVPILSALALLSGALLSVFAQLSSLRLRLTDRPEERWLDIERDGIDEAVAHLLFAFLLCIITCALLTIGMSTSFGGKDAPLILGSLWTAPIAASTTYIFALFVILVPKLYSAYVEMNHVRKELNGFHKSIAHNRNSQVNR